MSGGGTDFRLFCCLLELPVSDKNETPAVELPPLLLVLDDFP